MNLLRGMILKTNQKIYFENDFNHRLHETHHLESQLKAQVRVKEEEVVHILCGPTNNKCYAYVEKNICDSDLVKSLTILGELNEPTCVLTPCYHEDDPLGEHNVVPASKLEGDVMEVSDLELYVHGDVF